MMEYENLTETIIGCAYKVYNTMGYGFLESVYENCLLIELKKSGLQALSQKEINVFYNAMIVGNFKADIIVEDTVILELKSVKTLAKAHEVQLFNYLTATRKPVGLLINFSPHTVEIKRKHLPS